MPLLLSWFKNLDLCATLLKPQVSGLGLGVMITSVRNWLPPSAVDSVYTLFSLRPLSLSLSLCIYTYICMREWNDLANTAYRT